MKIRTLSMASAIAASVIGLAHAADVKEVQMLHWWTSGGEAAALNVLKQDLAKEGYAWKDVPVAGGGGEGAMTALKAMVAAGNPPTASQILGYFAIDYAEAGKLGDITSLAKKERWDKVVPTALQKFTTTDGKWDAVPVNIHSVNWVWINKAAMEKISGTEPKTFNEFVALLDKAKKAGLIPLALGGQPWQEATMFNSVVAATGGIDFYKKAFVDLDEDALKSDTMRKAFDNLAKLKAYIDPNYAGRDWNLATAMVIKGDALVQVMGDWAKGEFKAANKKAGKDFLCYRFPGTDGSVIYNADMFALFDVPSDRRAAQLAFADAAMSQSFQSAFNVVKGSVPARMDVPDTAFDMCGKKGIADLKTADERGTLVGSMAQNYAQPPAIAGAYHDVVTKFFHGEIKTSDAAAKELLAELVAAGAVTTRHVIADATSPPVEEQHAVIESPLPATVHPKGDDVATTGSGRKVALIVANSVYRDAPLTNPAVDAIFVRDSLAKIGFSVTVKTNLDIDGFEAALSDFAEESKGADVALFYFAGHGFSLAIDGVQRNLLMTTSANFSGKSAVALQQGGEELEHVENSIIGRARATLIFVDACRSVPILASRGVVSRGFYPLDTSAFDGAYVVLSTRVGKTAEDGEAGMGSPFARAFAAIMPTPGLRVEDAYYLIRDKVKNETSGEQVPDAVRSDLPRGGVVLMGTNAR